MAGSPEPKLLDLFHQSWLYTSVSFAVKQRHTTKIPMNTPTKRPATNAIISSADVDPDSFGRSVHLSDYAVTAIRNNLLELQKKFTGTHQPRDLPFFED
jgi:hypothetical protein